MQNKNDKELKRKEKRISTQDRVRVLFRERLRREEESRRFVKQMGFTSE